MTGLRISEVSERTGLAASTIRYYETVGVLAPAGRGANGYRVYSDSDVDTLAFVAGAKRLNLSLAEVKEMTKARQSDVCAHVQRDMRPVVAARLAQTEKQIAELSRLVDELRAAAARLDEAPKYGACSAECACTVLVAVPSGVRLLPLTERVS